MKRAATILLGIGLTCALIYLSWLNPTPVEFHLTPTWQTTGQVGALMGAAFTAGAVFVILFVTIGAARRAMRGWSSERRRRKTRRIDEWELRGEQLVWQGEVQRGRALMQKALQRRPEDSRAVLALAASYRDTGELHRARGVLYDAATQNHTEPEVLYALAEAHRSSGEIGPYTDVLERLRALFPRAPRALRALRDAYEESGRWQDAMALQEALLNEIRDPESLNRERQRLLALRYQIGLSLSDSGARLRTLESLADGRAPALPVVIGVGDAMVAMGRKEEASVLWERALRSNPRTVLVERLAAIATDPKHKEKLRGLLRKLRAEHVNQPSMHLLTAKLLLEEGNTKAAAQELEHVPAHDKAPELWHRLSSEIHRNRGEVDQALATLGKMDRVDHYRCKTCHRSNDIWIGYCPVCHDWDSYRSAVEIGRL